MRLPRIKPQKQTISSDEWESIKDRANATQELLEDPRFAFFREYLSSVQSSIVDYFVKNKIRPVQEHLKISDILTKTLTTTKAEQEAELSGKYQLVDDMLADLKRIASLPDEYRQAHERGEIDIEEDKEKHG